MAVAPSGEYQSSLYLLFKHKQFKVNIVHVLSQELPQLRQVIAIMTHSDCHILMTITY